MAETFWDGFSEPLGQLVHFGPRILAALIVTILSVLIGRVAGRSVVRLFERASLSQTHKLFFRNLALWFCILFGIAVALNVLGLETALAGFIAGSGVAAVVAGFAFKEIGENLLAGLFLAFSRPFNIGDFIMSDTLEGEVREIELRYTHIRTADGRDIYIPNSQIFNKPLVNFTRDGLRRPSFTVGIDYADDAERARALLLDVVRSASDILDDPGPNVLIAKLAPQYVELEVNFWVNSFAIGEVASASRIVQEDAISRIRSQLMSACRRALTEQGFTVSANVTTNVALDTPRQISVGLAQHDRR